jgi:dipeptidyl aminopeptidase/acylaminoacyl peptidase
MSCRSAVIHILVLTICATFSITANAQSAELVLTADDYARAERLLAGHTRELVVGDAVRPNWLSGDRMWYRNTVAGGAEFVLVNPATGTRERAFDHARLAAAISAISDTTFEALGLPFSTFEYSGDETSITFEFVLGRYNCDIDRYACTVLPDEKGGEQSDGPPSRFGRRVDIPSPDGSLSAFIRDYNLWVRVEESGEERQLTTDGIEDFGYATNNAGWTKSDAPVVKWSPDSRKIATFQHDGRGVGSMHMVSTESGHPRLESWKYPLPGDSLIFRIERVVIDVETGDVVRLKMPADPHRSTITDHVAYRGEWADVEWSDDSSRLFFVSTSRNHQEEVLREGHPETGEVRDILKEVVDTFYESGASSINWTVLEGSNEVLWYSQRDNWGHLYLYDLETGELESQITSGDWNVLDVVDIDEDARRILFVGNEREPGDPYYRYLYSVNMDGSGLQLLTPEMANHTTTLAPSKAYFVDSYSTPVEPPVAVLRDLSGRLVVELEEADISALVAYGWRPPIPVTVKARDGETDIHGLMYKPSHFDPSGSYPVINYVYPGPQTGSVGSRSFSPARGDKQALAELGFIVVEVDAMGTPLRSKSFHAAYYGNMGDNGIPDQIAAIEQLAAENPQMDLDHVGIYGHSGGGFASTAAILRYPDFYKVAVSQAGNHDNATYEDDWGEKWQGLLERYPNGTTSYDNQANHLVAENLKGKLLLAHGSMDSNVPPNNTMLVVDALIEANKDFDLIIFPNRRHGFGNEPYMMRRRWDYFVENLLGATPPANYEFGKRDFSDTAL